MKRFIPILQKDGGVFYFNEDFIKGKVAELPEGILAGYIRMLEFENKNIKAQNKMLVYTDSKYKKRNMNAINMIEKVLEYHENGINMGLSLYALLDELKGKNK